MAASAFKIENGSDFGARGASAVANPKFLLELIVADLHWSALEIGALTLMTAAAAARGSTIELRFCRHLVYDDTRVMRLALRYGADAGLSDDVRRKLDRLYADIGEAMKPLASFVQTNSLTAGQRDQLQRVLPVLRKVAQTAGEGLAAIESVTRAALNSDYSEDSLVIRRFLERAGRGDLVDIDSTGVLVPPRLKQRRQSPRAKVSRPCRLVSSAGEFAAEIADASREGLGLVCNAPLALGETVTVRVDGRQLAATVKRLDGSQIGLLLKQSLPLGDPLFTGG